MCYRCTPFNPSFIPGNLDEAATYHQQIRYLNQQIEDLKKRVAELESKHSGE